MTYRKWVVDLGTASAVAEGSCTVEQFALPECPFEAACPCQFVVRCETATPKPRVLSIANARSATRMLIVANLGPREESIEFRVTLTPSSLLASDRLSTADVNPVGVPQVSQKAARLRSVGSKPGCLPSVQQLDSL